MVHIAVFDAVNAIAGGYQSYAGLFPAPANSSMDTAIALAAHDTLAALFPSQTPSFNAVLTEELGKIPDGRAKRIGIDLGRRAAAAILQLRANDGSQHAEPRVGMEYIPSDALGKWQQDLISKIPIALGAYWGGVQPFVLKSSDQFRAPVPPPLDSSEYTAAFDEVKRLGGDGVVRRSPGSSGPTTERRACARRRGCTTRSRCRSPTRWARRAPRSRDFWRW